jgi:hypothetical protein
MKGGNKMENKIEYKSVPLSEEEVVRVRYNLDDLRLKCLNQENKIKLMQYKVDNDVPMRTAKVQLEGIITKLEELKKELALAEEDEKKETLVFNIMSLEFALEEKKLEIETALPTRDMNQAIELAKTELHRLELNKKVYFEACRNKVKKVPQEQNTVQ